MTESDDFDDIFGEEWARRSLKEFLESQRNMERRLREYIKDMIESLKRGELQGRSEIVPIDKPGVTGFIFRGVFGTPESLEGEGKIPRLDQRQAKDSSKFSLGETQKEEARTPVVEKFENTSGFVVLVELPGAEENDIVVEAGDGSITIRALNFRTINVDVPPNCDIRKMERRYKNGVLELNVPTKPVPVRDDNTRIGVA